MISQGIKSAVLLLLALMSLGAVPRKASAQAISSLNEQFIGQSANWPAAADQVARKIAALTGQSSVNVVVDNRSTVASQEAAEVEKLIVGRLRLAGVRVSTTAGAAYEVKVVISENAREYELVVSTTGTSGEPEFFVAPAARAAEPSTVPAELHKQLLIAQDRPILDTQLLNETTLIVLEPERVTIYAKQNGEWQSRTSAEIALHRPLPRDLRGHLVLNGAAFDAYLPGMVCNAASLAPLAVSCRESDDPWPIGGAAAYYNSARNYFTRASGEFSDYVNKFYSAAFYSPSRTETHVIFTTDQGIFRDGPSGPLPVTANFGSDVVVVQENGPGQPPNACIGSHVLATSSSDYTQTDNIRAYEIYLQRAIAASDPLEFAGPVTALWNGSEPSSAIAIAHNLKTSHYEAYRVTAACVQ